MASPKQPEDDDSDHLFIKRCLVDETTGKLYLAKRDRDRLRKMFASAGYDVNQGFDDSESLIVAYLETLDPLDFLWVRERARLRNPDIEDRLPDIERWTDVPRPVYLRLRIYAKLLELGVAAGDFHRFVREECGERFVSGNGKISFWNEKRVLELDRMLEAKLREKSPTGSADTE